MSNPSSIRSMVRSPIAQIDLDLGIGGQEFGDHRRDELDDVSGGVDAQRAARRRLQGARDVIGLFEVGKDLDGAVVIGLARPR